jgi:Tol biopolymer transport system component
MWVDRTGAVTGRAVPELVANPRDPRLSPDGQRLLLITGPEDDGNLWSYDLRGRPPIPLALENNNRFPVWSPDGRQVVFLADPANAALPATRTGVMTVAADGTESAPRSLRTNDYGPQFWSAAGELILIRRGPDIVAAPADATAEVRILVAPGSPAYDPMLSPNGRWLAYVSHRTGREEIWVQGYPDGAPVRVSSNGGHEPLWSADGRELFYRQADAIMAVNVDADASAEFSFTAPQRLFGNSSVIRNGPGSRSYDVARDGRFLMIMPNDTAAAAAAAASIIVVQNFAEEVKQRARPSGR